MANLTKSLTVNGQEYEFVGKQWYGDCNSSAQSSTKTVSITGFTSADLVTGTQVTIRFLNAQNYNGTPSLSIGGVSKFIYRASGVPTGRYEWSTGEIITLVYSGSEWFIVKGGRASTTYYGDVKLSDTIANDSTTALTPKAVYDAGYVNTAQAASAAPVQSVNGQTGAVSLAIPTVPTNVSSFNNDAGYLTISTLPIWDGSVT